MELLRYLRLCVNLAWCGASRFHLPLVSTKSEPRLCWATSSCLTTVLETLLCFLSSSVFFFFLYFQPCCLNGCVSVDTLLSDHCHGMFPRGICEAHKIYRKTKNHMLIKHCHAQLQISASKCHIRVCNSDARQLFFFFFFFRFPPCSFLLHIAHAEYAAGAETSQARTRLSIQACVLQWQGARANAGERGRTRHKGILWRGDRITVWCKKIVQRPCTGVGRASLRITPWLSHCLFMSEMQHAYISLSCDDS